MLKIWLQFSRYHMLNLLRRRKQVLNLDSRTEVQGKIIRKQSLYTKYDYYSMNQYSTRLLPMELRKCYLSLCMFRKPVFILQNVQEFWLFKCLDLRLSNDP
jgi:hypothetical protein